MDPASSKYLYVSILRQVLGPDGHGPSSSHTIAPQRLAYRLWQAMGEPSIVSAEVELFNSFATTWKGHCTDIAITAGLLGYAPTNTKTPNARNDSPWKLKRKPKTDENRHDNALVIHARTATAVGTIEANSIGGGNTSTPLITITPIAAASAKENS